MIQPVLLLRNDRAFPAIRYNRYPMFGVAEPPRCRRTLGFGYFSETVASLPGADSKVARQEKGESTWDPLNVSELAPNSANGLIPSLIAWAKSQPPGNDAIVSGNPWK